MIQIDNLQKNKGFTMLVAIVTTSLLLIVSYMVVNLAFKQLTISSFNKESQYAFYAAESGIECAVFWDLKDSASSKFSTSTASSITCNGESPISGGSQSIPGGGTSLIGGGGNGSPTSLFYLTFTKGCAVVRVTKAYVGAVLQTTIDSRGYNTCNTSVIRRVERGVTLKY